VTADRLKPRLLLRIALLLLLSPWLVAVGLGIPTRAGGWIDGWLHRLLFFTSDVIPFVEAVFFEPTLPVFGLMVGSALVWGLVAVERSIPAALRWMPGLPEIILALVGLVAATGLFAVGCGLDRLLFWVGLGVATLSARSFARVPRSETAAALRPPAWSDPTLYPLRVLLLPVVIGLVLLAGVTLLEGPGYHSPPFRLRELWLDGPGRSGWTSGGLWLLPGLVISAWVWWRRRSLEGPRRRVWPWGLGIAVIAAVALIRQLWIGPAGDYRIASALSMIGLLLVAAGWPLLRRALPDVGSPFDSPDPRRLLAQLLPVLLWCALCAGRGLTCFMWTAPGDLPPGVERIADVAGAFSLDVEPRTGAIFWSDRDRHELGVVHPDGNVTVTPIDGPDAPEELLVARDGLVWASLAGEETSGVVAVHTVDGPRWPGVSFPSRCWISGFFELPGQAAAAVGLPLGTVLAGCEQGGEVWLLTPDLSVGKVMTVPEEVEQAAFSRDGDTLFLVGLWAGSSVWRLGWPELQVEARRTIGSFNWGVVADDARGLVWVTRFFEGTLLALDAQTLEPRLRVSLSFGPRVMVHDPVHDLLWISAAYSGRIWAVDPQDPSRRTSWALCGQGRAIVTDDLGRAIVATDCGLFRIDPPMEGL
jgi:hypothetical protein